MADLLTLTCPSCGGQLQVTNETDRYVCAHCGNSHVVDPGVRMASLAAEVEKLHAESRLRQLDRELDELAQKQYALKFEIEGIRSGAVSTGCTYQAGIVAAFISALALTAYAVSEILKGHSDFVGPVLGLAVFIAVMGVIAARVYPSVKVIPNHDATLQQLVVIERRIAQRQRERDTLQQQVSQDDAEDVTSSDTEHATPNTHQVLRIPTT